MKKSLLVVFIISGLSLVTPLYAYIGPGAGVSALGTALIFVLVIVLLLVGFLWYPIKKLMNKKNQDIQLKQETENTNSDSDQARGL